ncbi:MAG: UDP-N-acetylglucosamine 1-carboxyvinyltransferase [Clostridiales bacterium]|jgi:UDP-N-acetylglucosamine 1-carboxyvinyltransferase|nr:UDP-N-acetylglucosamine 1-carboxyvinyltransferase [Clostridiales bacterium]
MEQIVITGQKRLSGAVHINGAKNAAVAIIPAAIAANGVSIIENLPHIEDVIILANAIKSIGVVCEFKDEHTLMIDSRGVTDFKITYDLTRNMRASYYLLGSLLGRFKRAVVPLPGGCNFGSRPIDQHIKGFEAMGANIVLKHGLIHAYAEKLTGSHIYLDMASVGATINIMLAAVYAEGVTTIENAAREPHVVDTANFLNILGAKIKGAGTDMIRITGVAELYGAEYQIIPDQIEAGTYMIASAITCGDIKVCNIIPKHMDSLSAKLIEMNCELEEGDDYIRVMCTDSLQAVNVITMAYPGFPTDLQPQMTALMSTVKGTSIITETVFDNRFQYVTELRRLGSNVTVEGRVAVIEGGAALSGAEVNAVDLRAGAALVVAGLAARGDTTISNIKHIDRGYEDIENKLRSLGANIRRVDTVAGVGHKSPRAVF